MKKVFKITLPFHFMVAFLLCITIVVSAQNQFNSSDCVPPNCVPFSSNMKKLETKPMGPETKYRFLLKSAKMTNLDIPEKNYSGRCFYMGGLAEVVELYLQKGLDVEPIYQELINFLKDDPYPMCKMSAAFALGFTKKKEAVPYLLKALNDNSLGVQLYAANAIMDLGDDNMKALAVLAEISTKSDLTKMTDKEKVNAGVNPFELRMDDNTKNNNTVSKIEQRWRIIAIKGLKKSKSEYAKKVLTGLKNDNDPAIRQTVSEGN